MLYYDRYNVRNIHVLNMDRSHYNYNAYELFPLLLLLLSVS